MPPIDDLGPLPQADGTAQLQRESLSALHAFLSPSDWILRDERVDDLGVDAQLEVLIDGQGTNFRAHVQLKGRSGLAPNQDGSLSVSVSTANLNYLLNGTAPLYLLYRAEHREFRFAFARMNSDESRGAASIGSARIRSRFVSWTSWTLRRSAFFDSE